MVVILEAEVTRLCKGVKGSSTVRLSLKVFEGAFGLCCSSRDSLGSLILSCEIPSVMSSASFRRFSG